MSDQVYNQVVERMSMEPAFAARVQSGDAAALAGLDLTDAERTELLAIGADEGATAKALQPRISKSAIIGGGGGAAHHAAAVIDPGSHPVDGIPGPHVIDVGHPVDVGLPTDGLDHGTHMDPTGHPVPNDPAHFHLDAKGDVVPNDPGTHYDPATGKLVPDDPAHFHLNGDGKLVPGASQDGTHGSGGGGGAGKVVLGGGLHTDTAAFTHAPSPGDAPPPPPPDPAPAPHSGLHTEAIITTPTLDGGGGGMQTDAYQTGGHGHSDAGLGHVAVDPHAADAHVAANTQAIDPHAIVPTGFQPFNPGDGAHTAGSNGAGYVTPPDTSETGQTQTGLYHHPDGSTEHDYANGDHVITEKDGTVIVEHNTGETVTIHPDGTWSDMHADGTTTEYYKSGDVVNVALDGTSTHAHTDGTTDFYDASNHLLKTVFPDGTYLEAGANNLHTAWGSLHEPSPLDGFHSFNAADGSNDTWPYGTMDTDSHGYHTHITGNPDYPGHPVVVAYGSGWVVFDSPDHATYYQVPGGETSYDASQTASLVDQLRHDQADYVAQQAKDSASYGGGGSGGGGYGW